MFDKDEWECETLNELSNGEDYNDNQTKNEEGPKKDNKEICTTKRNPNLNTYFKLKGIER